MKATFAFTGHRPDKLGGYKEFNKDRRNRIAVALRAIVVDFVKENPTIEHLTVITGGALGIDTCAFFAAESIKKSNLIDVPLLNVLAVPAENQDKSWFDEKDRERYQLMLQLADDVVIVHDVPGYETPDRVLDSGSEKKIWGFRLNKRNEYMVDNCDLLIAVWDGTSGGTGNCVAYAQTNAKQIYFVEPKEII